MIYIIGGCHLGNHKEECIIVKNKSLMIEEMTNIVGALANLYFFSTGKESCPPKELLDILVKRVARVVLYPLAGVDHHVDVRADRPHRFV